MVNGSTKPDSLDTGEGCSTAVISSIVQSLEEAEILLTEANNLRKQVEEEDNSPEVREVENAYDEVFKLLRAEAVRIREKAYAVRTSDNCIGEEIELLTDVWHKILLASYVLVPRTHSVLGDKEDHATLEIRSLNYINNASNELKKYYY